MANKAMELAKDVQPLYPVKRDLFKELANATGDTAIWSPAEGDMIVGILVGRDRWDTENGPADVAIIAQEDKDGEQITVFLNPSALWRMWQQENPRIMDRVGIKFCGTAEAKSGRTFNKYALVVDRNPANYPVITEEGSGLPICTMKGLAIPDPFEE